MLNVLKFSALLISAKRQNDSRFDNNIQYNDACVCVKGMRHNKGFSKQKQKFQVQDDILNKSTRTHIGKKKQIKRRNITNLFCHKLNE